MAARHASWHPDFCPPYSTPHPTPSRHPFQESLAALFGMPLGVAAQLVAKHPALATIPPNVTITKCKALSIALGVSMQVWLGGWGG